MIIPMKKGTPFFEEGAVRYVDTAIEGHHGTKADETCEVEQGSPFIIVAPSRKGYVFEKWLDSAGAELAPAVVAAAIAVFVAAVAIAARRRCRS